MAGVCCRPLAPTKVLTQHPPFRIQRAAMPARRLLDMQVWSFGKKSVDYCRPERSGALVVRMGIRAVESFDAAFQLTTESEQLLQSMLTSDSFIKQVARDCSLSKDVKPEFTGELFQPVPWSQTTKHGMLPEYEKYYHDKENYVIANVPPQIMFQAKVFKPSRLCAIFKRSPATS